MSDVVCSAIPGFDDHAARWDALADRLGAPAVLKARFVRHALDVFGDDDVVLVGDDDPAAEFLFLVARSKKGLWESFQPSQAPLGLALVGPDADPKNAIGRALDRLPGLGIGISILQQDPEHSPFDRLVEGGVIERMPYIETAYLDIEGGWDDYWKSRSRNLRHNLKRQRRRLAESGKELKLITLSSPTEMRAAIERYASLEASGWKTERGSAVSFANDQGTFYHRMLEAACTEGAGAVYELRFGEQTVASDLCVEQDGTMIVLKTAYDASIPGLSLGLLLHQELFHALFERGDVRRVEFYGRVLDWHRKWTSTTKELFHVSLYRSALLPGAKRVLRRVSGTK